MSRRAWLVFDLTFLAAVLCAAIYSASVTGSPTFAGWGVIMALWATMAAVHMYAVAEGVE